MAGAAPRDRPRGWRRVRRWIARALLGALALAVLAVVAVVIALHTAWGRERVRRIAESALDGTLGGPARIGEVEEVSVWGALDVKDLELDGPDGRPVVTIASLHVDVGLVPLIDKRVRVDQLAVAGVRVTWHGAKPPPEPEEPSEPSAWVIDLRGADVTDAHVAIDRPGAAPIAFSVKDAHAAARIAAGEISARGSAQVTWAPGELPVAGAGGAFVAGAYASDRPIDAVVFASVEGEPVMVAGSFDPGALHARGVAAGRVPAALLAGQDRVRDAGGAAVIDLGLGGGAGAIAERVAGRVAVAGDAIVDGSPAGGAVAVAIDRGEASVVASAHGAGGAHVAVDAGVAVHGAQITLDHAHATAGVDDPGAASGHRVEATGAARFDVIAHGTLAPTLSLVASGTADVDRPALADLDLGGAALHVDVADLALPALDRGTATVKASGLRRGDRALGGLTVIASPRGAGGYAVGVTAQPARGWTIAADTVVTTGATTTIAIVRDRVVSGRQRWQGAGGTITIAPDALVASGLRAASPDGALALDDLRYVPADGAIAATVSARGLDADALARLAGLGDTWRGALDGRAQVRRAGDRWTGTLTADLRRGAMTPDAPPIDVHAEASLGDRVTLHVRGGGGWVGTAQLDGELAPPADLTDVAAWRRRGRASLRSLRVQLAHVDVAAAESLIGDHGTIGAIDADVTLTATDARGEIHLRGVGLAAVPGSHELDADVALAGATSPRGAITASGTAGVGGIAVFAASATVAPPERLLDPAAWRALGARALVGASAHADDVDVDAALLARFGITSPIRARVSVAVELDAAAAGAKLTVDARGVRGGPIRRPIALHADATVDAGGTRGAAALSSHGVTLARATATMPLGLDDVIAGGVARLLAAPLTAHAEAPPAALGSWLEIVGRRDARGTVGASIDVAGSAGAPTAIAAITASEVRDAMTPMGVAVPELRALAAHARWDGHALAFDADASEAAGGALHATATGDPRAPGAMQLAVRATRFDLAPLALVAPGVLAGAGGVIDADLAQRGLGLEALRGTFHVTRASFPLSSTVGTLRDGDLTGQVGGGRVSIKGGAALGRGRVEAAGTVSFAAPGTTIADGQLQLRGVSPIGLYEPRIDGTVAATLRAEGDHLRAKLTITGADVDVPRRAGDELHAVGPPRDLVFADARAPAGPQGGAPGAGGSSSPWLIVDVALGPTQVTTEEARAVIRGNLTLALGGDELGIDGEVTTDRADVDILGRRYDVGHANVQFDGTTDGILDVGLSYKFTALELFVDVTGRVSKPVIKLSSEPADQTEDQLFSYLLGAEPGGDPGTQARDAAAGAAAAAASSVVGHALNQFLPLGLDVLRYTPATSSSSSAVTVGKWFRRRTFLGITYRSAPLPLIENDYEGDFEQWLGNDWLLHVTAGDNQVGNADLSHSWRF